MWFRVDDSFYDHPKAVGLSDNAVALWTRTGAWSGKQLTDGLVPLAMVEQFARGADAAKVVAAELMDHRLWEPGADAIQFHDWADYNPTREQVLARRAADTKRRRRHLEQYRDPDTGRVTDGATDPVTHGVTPGVTPGVTHGVKDGVTHGVTDGGSHTDQASHQPDPTRPEGSGVVQVGKQHQDRNAHEASAEDDARTEIEHAVMAFMTGAGHHVNRAQAAALIDMALAGRKPRDPGAYVLATLKKDPAAALRRVATSRQPPPARDVLPDARRPGGAATEAQRTARAAEARALLAAKLNPAPPEAADAELPDW